MANGEYRVGLSSASQALGFSKEWLGRSLKRNGNQIKALQSMSFEGKIKKLATESIKGKRELIHVFKLGSCKLGSCTYHL